MCYYNKVETKQPSMTKQEEQQLIKTAQGTGRRAERARMAILNKYDRLCHKLARKFAFVAPSYQHEDLVQEGRIGLLQAISTYDAEFGASFMTWAYYNVRGNIAGAGRVEKKEPRYAKSIEDTPRAYNVEDPSQEIKVRDDLSVELVKRIVEESCGGMHTKRANVVMDRFGLLGRKELRNFECAEKYGITKYAVNSHTFQFKKRAREKFPHLAEFI